MKKVFLLVILSIQFVLCYQANAQLYGNEWIDYNQSYYKFKIYQDGLYRIPVTSLTALGMPNSVQGANLQLFRDGEEVTLYVSNSGALTTNDYIEFYGEKANGKLDARLYKNQNDQLNPELNLISDTAFYFITYNASTSNKRFNPISNNLSNPPLKETYFWDKIQASYRNSFLSGPSYFGQGETPVIYLNSSQYEAGEGYSKTVTYNNDSITITCASPYLVSGGPAGTFKTTLVGSSYLTTHRVKIFANGNEIADSTFNSFGFKRYNVAVPMSYVNAQNKMVFKYTPLNSIPSQSLYDRYGIAYTEFRYPRLFNFNNQSEFYFELDPKITDYYLEISNFNTAGVQPRLYDLTSNEFIIGDISSPGIVRFLIPASNQVKKLFLKSLGNSSFNSVSELQNVSFTNYTNSSNQGDYIILSHNGLINDGLGNITSYKNYRASAAGGAYSPIIVDVMDIYNEFGYGYNYSSLAIKNFLNYAVNNANWNNKPKHAFIIGKGINYKDFRTYSAASSTTYPFYAVPSFGEPCSDQLLTDFNNDNKPKLSIGRIPVWNSNEVKDYLDKVKDHEQVIANSLNLTSDSVLWQKRVLHLAGTSNLSEQIPILASLNSQANTIKGPYFGGEVTTLKKTSTSPVEAANSKIIDDMVNTGVGIIQFFGHSSSSGMDYNLDFPENYTNYKKYPLFIANGCGAGNIFILNGPKSLGERFVLTPNRGSIAFIASVNTGLSGSLAKYTDSLYSHIGRIDYGKALGLQIKNNVNALMTYSPNDNLLRLHTEQILLNGDPATFSYNYPKPDYAVELKDVNFSQQNFTTSVDSLDLMIAIHNLGKFSTDSVSLLIKRILPNGVENVLNNTYVSNLSNSDTLYLKVPTYGDIALGANFIEVSLDEESVIDELSESNNKIRKQFTIYNDDLVPVFPYDFSIVSNQGITLKASTLNPFSEMSNYLIQIDTTEKFNSPLLKSTNISSKGGVVKWQPNITLKDSTVYYWRTAQDTSSINPFHRWTNSSFIYIPQSLPGWNQSHYFQFQKDAFNQVRLDSADRKFKFSGLNKKLQVQNVCHNGPAPFTYIWADYVVKINGSSLYTFGCDPYPGYSSLQFIIIDTLTGEPWKNSTVGNTGRFGSYKPCRVGCDANGNNCADPYFEFSFLTVASRKNIMDFIDSIPQGYYVMMQPRLCVGAGCGGGNKVFIKDWKNDTTVYGPNNSLYHKIKDLGFTSIDSFYKNRPMISWMRKGDVSSIQQLVEIDSTKILYGEFDFYSSLFQGTLTSTKIGPASMWSDFTRVGFTNDPTLGDTVSVDIIGFDLNNTSQLLATVYGDTSLSFIDPKQFPYLQLRMNTSDNLHSTPEQVKNWRIHYQPVPEAALNPNRNFVFKDSLGQGQKSYISVAIENLTEIPMDSMLVQYDIIDNNGNKRSLGTKRYRPLPILDTIIADLEINRSDLSGLNTLFVEVNPDNDQLEQFHPNNLGYKTFYVEPDTKNPLIDVTFDGIHILDKDIVSSKPFIQISLKDENKYLALDDSSLVGVYMRYPGENVTSETYIPYDNNVLKFIPATLTSQGGKNQAIIEFKPTFTVDGDDYMLIVKGKDKSGNLVGINSYKVGFEVLNKPSISSVVNYPNPFTTSTQFVFTLTGSEIPSNMKIQILSPTGKVVREILKSELGPLHIGRNITEFKWKGDDQFGQPLGNGVYLYRVISTLNGTKMDTYTSGADKWMEKGFGKLYIMR